MINDSEDAVPIFDVQINETKVDKKSIDGNSIM